MAYQGLNEITDNTQRKDSKQLAVSQEQ